MIPIPVLHGTGSIITTMRGAGKVTSPDWEATLAELDSNRDGKLEPNEIASSRGRSGAALSIVASVAAAEFCWHRRWRWPETVSSLRSARRGDMTVIRAGNQWETPGTFDLRDSVSATPAIGAGTINLRTHTQIAVLSGAIRAAGISVTWSTAGCYASTKSAAARPGTLQAVSSAARSGPNLSWISDSWISNRSIRAVEFQQYRKNPQGCRGRCLTRWTKLLPVPFRGKQFRMVFNHMVFNHKEEQRGCFGVLAGQSN